jgi:archaellin
VGLRLKAGSIGAAITIESVALMEDAEGNFYEWSLVFNPTVAGTFTYSNETNSTCQTATGATANEVTGGTIITGGFGVSRKTNSPILTNPKNALRLGAAIDGTVDTIVLCVTPLAGSSNLDVHGAMTWREQS